MTSRTPAAGRREPQQGRSRETVDRILTAADQEIGEVGLAAASTTRIARRAGLSVGALYRFFHDKDAIAVALARQYLHDVTQPYVEAISGLTSRGQLGAALDLVVDRAAALRLDHPGYYRLTEELAPELDDSPAHQVRERLIGLFVDALVASGVDEPEADLRRVVELCIETVRHTLVRAPVEPAEREAVVAELKRMLASYLTARVGELA
ncbi:TetR/AcrR family transcriptional regulator [Nocardioides sp. LHG3406-4]|uniref:TetR/AcrR family transcriptional regulator n=1 Tax=Nocardioides sp. LHG3406-4 TaxID=2804575 RepID=UPI003CF36878